MARYIISILVALIAIWILIAFSIKSVILAIPWVIAAVLLVLLRGAKRPVEKSKKKKEPKKRIKRYVF